MADQQDNMDSSTEVKDITADVKGQKVEADAQQSEAEKKYIKATYAFEMNDLDEALMLIRSALALNPGNPKYHYNIAFLYWRKGLLEVAINHYKMFLRYAPETDKDRQTIKDRIKFLEGKVKSQQRRPGR